MASITLTLEIDRVSLSFIAKHFNSFLRRHDARAIRGGDEAHSVFLHGIEHEGVLIVKKRSSLLY